MAEELIASDIIDRMEENKKISKASDIDELSFEKIEKSLETKNWDYISKFSSYITVDISAYAEK